jgi:hypothetical protein
VTAPSSDREEGALFEQFLPAYDVATTIAVIEYVEVDVASFTDFDRPGFAKTVYALAVAESAGGGTVLTGTMRTAKTSASARRWFDRYRTFGVGSGAHVLVRGLLEVVRKNAEGAST